MIVEDESIVAMDIEIRLKRLGYVVVRRATSGAEALQQALLLRPDLILMDIRLQGGIDGIEAATRIRAHHNIPIVYLTAYSDSETLRRAKITEPSGFLIKPFDERELHSVIEMALYKNSMEAKLRQQAKQLQTIINTIPEGIFLLAADGQIMLANPVGLEYLALMVPEAPRDRITMLGNYSLQSITANSETWLQVEVNEPSRRVFEVTAKPSFASDVLEERQWVLAINDVTKQHEVLHRSYQQSNLAAIGQLAAGIAHDFNNILSILLLGDQIVLRTQPDLKSENRQRLEGNILQIRRGGNLISQVLDYSRSSHIDAQSCNLVSLVKQTIAMLKRTLPEDISVKLAYDREDLALLADPNRIQQILMNLAINARDAMPLGGEFLITLSEENLLTEDQLPISEMRLGSWMKIRCSDSGTGIPDHVLPHIFEPFFTTKPHGQGSGLGLAQVHGLVRQHQGFIQVTSQEGRGTSFDIHLPILLQEAVDGSSSDDVILNDVVEGDTDTILIVEDETMLRENLADVLELLNYRVVKAADGVEALQLYDEYRSTIQLVLTDMVMPKMGGFELCKALRSRDTSLPIVTMSGYSSKVNTGELRDLNIAKFMQKPIQPEVLSQAIRDVLHASPDLPICSATTGQ
jgi:signal transduction histidine kinase